MITLNVNTLCMVCTNNPFNLVRVNEIYKLICDHMTEKLIRFFSFTAAPSLQPPTGGHNPTEEVIKINLYPLGDDYEANKYWVVIVPHAPDHPSYNRKDPSEYTEDDVSPEHVFA